MNAYQLSGSVFGRTVEVKAGSSFYADLYSADIQQAVSALHLYSANTVVTDQCTYKNTVFKKGSYLAFVDQTGTLTFACVIFVLVQNENDVYFISSVHCSEHDTTREAWCVELSTRNVRCVLPDELVHEHPLNAYHIGTKLFIPLKYAVFDSL